MVKEYFVGPVGPIGPVGPLGHLDIPEKKGDSMELRVILEHLEKTATLVILT